MMKLKNCVIAGLTLMLVTLSSCGDKNYYEYEKAGDNVYEGDNIYIDGALILSEQFDLDKSEFIWNPIYNRFECIIENVEITKDVFENGFVSATVFIDEVDKNGEIHTTQKSLTFSRKFPFPAGSNNWYEEKISADISVGAIGFFIEGLKETEKNILLDGYAFKVSIIWDASTQAQSRIKF